MCNNTNINNGTPSHNKKYTCTLVANTKNHQKKRKREKNKIIIEREKKIKTKQTLKQ